MRRGRAEKVVAEAAKRSDPEIKPALPTEAGPVSPGNTSLRLLAGLIRRRAVYRLRVWFSPHAAWLRRRRVSDT